MAFASRAINVGVSRIGDRGGSAGDNRKVNAMPEVFIEDDAMPSLWYRFLDLLKSIAAAPFN